MELIKKIQKELSGKQMKDTLYSDYEAAKKIDPVRIAAKVKAE